MTGEMFARIVEVNDALNRRESQRTRERKRNRNGLSKGNEKEAAEGVVRCALTRVSYLVRDSCQACSIGENIKFHLSEEIFRDINRRAHL